MSQAHDLSDIRYEGDGDHKYANIVIVVSKWNDKITDVLYQGAEETLLSAGVPRDQIQRFDVPGAFELPIAADAALRQETPPDGVIALGCVIQGETRHFDFISQAVAQGIMRVGLDHGKPVIFGVLTPDNAQQAADRSGGIYGNKGEEAAVALLELLDTFHAMRRAQ